MGAVWTVDDVPAELRGHRRPVGDAEDEWRRARLVWCAEHGVPLLDLLRADYRARRGEAAR